jgi:hypothetical protein
MFRSLTPGTQARRHEAYSKCFAGERGHVFGFPLVVATGANLKGPAGSDRWRNRTVPQFFDPCPIETKKEARLDAGPLRDYFCCWLFE